MRSPGPPRIRLSRARQAVLRSSDAPHRERFAGSPPHLRFGFRAAVQTTLRIALISLVVCGCAAPTSHTPAIYQDDPVAGAALTLRAGRVCIESNGNEGIQPIRPFVTDGCSRYSDTEWNLSCCVEHDIAYWCGGDAEARLAADTEFGECVAGGSNASLVGS